MSRPLRYGMVGGGRDAFIGAVHRKAMALDAAYVFVAGALSSQPEKAILSGQDLGLDKSRNYPNWQAMLEGELALPPEQRIEVVSIVTPNHVHFEVANAFAANGFHVVCDKPLVHTSTQAEALLATVAKSGVVFGVTYNYTGYPMVKQARYMVRSGQLGKIRKVVVEYNQGWLANKLVSKQAIWRTDPARSGIAGCVGDIGSHAENLIATVTGLELESLCADLTTFVAGRQLDDDANLLLRFAGGAKGVLIASQIEIGSENDVRLHVYGEKGSLHWQQENPNYLELCWLKGAKQIYSRGASYLCAEAQKASRLPPGHPEAFLEAFANVYLGIAEAIHAKNAGQAATGDFPTLEDGVRGVRFIEKTVESARSSQKWTAF
ncbi:MAG: Gfo/Idh/MocA family protein [Deinococcales bacterium]